MAIKRKVTRKQTDAEKELAKELRPFYDYLKENYWRITYAPFLSCNADYGIVDFNGNKWLVLRSYSTIVSAYLISLPVIVHFGRYSATTYQHQHKFEKYVDEFYNHFSKEIGTYWLDYVDNFQ